MTPDHGLSMVRRWVVPRPGPDGKPVGVLKIEVVPAEAYDRCREALDALCHAAREFSTAAAYTVRVDMEDDFLAALDDAERIVGGDHA